MLREGKFDRVSDDEESPDYILGPKFTKVPTTGKYDGVVKELEVFVRRIKESDSPREFKKNIEALRAHLLTFRFME